jgi:ketosteroid isomerase-like protein
MGAMSQENIEQLRAAMEAFNRTGEIVTEHLAPDFEMHQASSIVDTAGVFQGPESLHSALRELEESFENLQFEPERFLKAPGGEVVVLVHVRGRGRGSGLEMDNHIAWVWTFRGDKAVRWVVYEEEAQALEAVGLSERGAHPTPPDAAA